MIASHWRRAKELLSSHTPNETVEIMRSEGYWGRGHNQITIHDLQWLMRQNVETVDGGIVGQWRGLH